MSKLTDTVIHWNVGHLTINKAAGRDGMQGGGDRGGGGDDDDDGIDERSVRRGWQG